MFLLVPCVRITFTSPGCSIAAPAIWNWFLVFAVVKPRYLAAYTYRRLLKTHCFQLPLAKCLRFGHFTYLLTLLACQVNDQLLSLCGSKDCDDSEEDMQQLLSLLDDRVLPGFDAVSAALFIMMDDGMPKEVFVEDTIEWVVKLVKWHLLAIVYPHSSMFKG